MFLFLTIMILSALISFATEISDYLRLQKLFVPDQSNRLLQLRKELLEARSQLERLDFEDQPILRARLQTKISDLENRTMRELLNGQKNSTKQYVSRYALKSVLSLMLFVVSILNRYTPVMIFDERFSFKPLDSFLTFPCGVQNAISVPVWVLACNMTFRHVAAILQSKQKA